MTDIPERRDPVLVRPYITTEPAPEQNQETWPENAELPPPEDPTLVLPTVEGENAGEGENAAENDENKSKDARSGPALGTRLLILLGGIVLALAAGAYLIFGWDGGVHPHAPSAVLPELPANGPVIPGGEPSVKASPSQSKSASPSASAVPSISLSLPVPPPVTVPTSTATGTTRPTPTETALAPPASDQTGRITAASGRCLTLGGLLGIDGSPVTVSGCVGGSSQSFTLATDGTLRVSGRCVQTTGDGTVRTTGCGDSTSSQWRAGPSGTLISQSSGGCLTDPGTIGATTKAAFCSGSGDQTWSLP
jgi:hypothetical protein